MLKLAFLFPGQGSQYIGMGKSFYNNYPEAKFIFRQASEVLGFDLAKLCFNSSYEDISKSENVQPAILVISLIVFRLWQKKLELKPHLLVGHSFGELNALVCSGAIDFIDGIRIARLKGEIARDISQGKNVSMLIIKGVKSNFLNRVCKEHKGKAVVGAFNSPSQFILSGYKENLDKIKKIIEKKGGIVEELKTSAPFHSPLLKEGVIRLKNELLKIKYNDFKIPVLSSITKKIYKDDKDIIKNISSSYVFPVDWIGVVEILKKKKISHTIEMGPQRILTNLIKENNEKINPYSFNIFDDLKKLKKKFSFSNDKKCIIISRCLKTAICLKNNNDDTREYKNSVVKSYNEVYKVFNDVCNNGGEVSSEQFNKAILMLDLVMKTKKISEKEIENRWTEIYLDIGWR